MAEQAYGPFPVTVKGYEGDKTNSVSYSGQAARHVLHNSLKKAAGKGDGGNNAAEVEALMKANFEGSEEDLEIIAPASKDGFLIKQSTVNEISKGKNISGKLYNGAMPPWPGNLSGVDVALQMIKMAAASEQVYDPVNGMGWSQLIPNSHWAPWCVIRRSTIIWTRSWTPTTSLTNKARISLAKSMSGIRRSVTSARLRFRRHSRLSRTMPILSKPTGSKRVGRKRLKII